MTLRTPATSAQPEDRGEWRLDEYRGKREPTRGRDGAADESELE